MSFMSGLMMGASIGKGVHDMLNGKGLGQRIHAQSANHIQALQGFGASKQAVSNFALVSALPGRRRYRLRILVGNAALAEFLVQQLNSKNNIYSVAANHLTGGLLIYYDQAPETELALDKLMQQLERACAKLTPLDIPSHQSYVPTVYTKSWKTTGRFFNNHVRGLTGNSFDISALVSLFFLLRGIRKCLLYDQRPTGPSMIWWALHLLKGW